GDRGRSHAGVRLVVRVEETAGSRFARGRLPHNGNHHWSGLDFFAVDRRDYRRLYKIALRCRRDFEPPGSAPVLPADQAEVLWQNTIGYLEPANLRRIKKYGDPANPRPAGDATPRAAKTDERPPAGVGGPRPPAASAPSAPPR